MLIKTNNIPPLSANKTKFIGSLSKKTEKNQIILIASVGIAQIKQ